MIEDGNCSVVNKRKIDGPWRWSLSSCFEMGVSLPRYLALEWWDALICDALSDSLFLSSSSYKYHIRSVLDPHNDVAYVFSTNCTQWRWDGKGDKCKSFLYIYKQKDEKKIYKKISWKFDKVW